MKYKEPKIVEVKGRGNYQMRWWEPNGKLRSSTHATKGDVEKAKKAKVSELKGATVKLPSTKSFQINKKGICTTFISTLKIKATIFGMRCGITTSSSPPHRLIASRSRKLCRSASRPRRRKMESRFDTSNRFAAS